MMWIEPEFYQKFQLCEVAINDDGFDVNFTLCELGIFVFWYSRQVTQSNRKGIIKIRLIQTLSLFLMQSCKLGFHEHH